MTIQDYLRLVIIVGGYALLRPYLIQLGGKFQAKDHERELSEHETSSMAAMSPNSLRGQVTVPEDTDDDEEENEDGEHSGREQSRDADWGRRARRRQREMIRKMLEAEERARAEEGDDSDKEIEEFLVKDG